MTDWPGRQTKTFQIPKYIPSSKSCWREPGLRDWAVKASALAQASVILVFMASNRGQAFEHREIESPASVMSVR